MAYSNRLYPLLVFALAVVPGFIAGAALPRAQACSPFDPPHLQLVEADGDPTEVQKWEAYRDPRVLAQVEFDHVHVSEGHFRHNYFVLELDPTP